jgi:hypothetical protein
MALYLNNEASVKQPESRTYKSFVTLVDSLKAKQSYELILTVNCTSNSIFVSDSSGYK